MTTIYLLAKKICDKYLSILNQREQMKYENVIQSSLEAYKEGIKTRNKRNIFSKLLKIFEKKDLVGKNYVFVGCRYPELILSAPKSKSLLLCNNKNEVFFALRNNVDFITTSTIHYDILAAAHYKKPESLESHIKNWIQILNTADCNIFLLSTSDSKPVNIFFIELVKKIKKPVYQVCIQHGIFPNLEKPDYLAEGAQSSYNAVFDKSQEIQAKKYISTNESQFFILGPPWTIQNVREVGSPKVILVGTGGSDAYHSEYLESVSIFKKIDDSLSTLGLPVSYRPHSTDDRKLVKSVFKKINKDGKATLLSGNPKIFIGFNSTLMYEAYIAGHLVIGLKSSLVESRRSFSTSQEYSTQNLSDMVSFLSSITEIRRADNQRTTYPSLDKRLKKLTNDIITNSSNF